MTVMSNYDRRNARQKLIKVRTLQINKRRHWPMHDQLQLPSQRLNMSEQVEITRGTFNYMEDIIYELLESKKHFTVTDLAKFLLDSQLIHRHSRTDDIRNEDGLGEKKFQQKKNQIALKRKYALAMALDNLEGRTKSNLTIVSSWPDACAALTAVLKLPVSEAILAKSTTRTTAANGSQEDSVDAYARRVSAAITNRTSDLFLSGSRRKWKEIELVARPSKIGEGVDKDTKEVASVVGPDQARINRSESVCAKADKAFSCRFKEENEKYELRAMSKAVAEVEDRLREKEKVEEARKRAETLMRSMTREEQKIVRDAMYGLGPESEVIAQVGTDSVQRGSMQRLQPGQWLNDEVIHYFYVMLSKRDEELCHQSDSNRRRCHFFKSFFVTKMLNEGNADPELDGKYDYRNVKRWSKRVPGKDIFNLDKIFFPINEGRMHWICAVAFMQEKRIQMYDSMGSDGKYYLESLFQYIQDEHVAKKGVQLPNPEEWKLIPTTCDTPRQKNGYDCGVFTCMFADFLSKDCPLVFSQEHINQCRERIALSIMNGRAIM